MRAARGAGCLRSIKATLNHHAYIREGLSPYPDCTSSLITIIISVLYHCILTSIHQANHQKIIMLFLKALGLLPFVAMAFAGSSKFADTCENIDGEGTTLRGNCRVSHDGQLRTSSIDLNRCLKNDKGKLKVRGDQPLSYLVD
jgi:hypothetical protein